MTYPIRRRSSSGFLWVTSSSPIRMRPLVGSISRLIIFIVVVLPHPDGPTSITISPAGISSVTSSTAGTLCPGYCLVTPSSRMRSPRVPFAVPASVVAESGTDTPRGGETGHEAEQEVEDDSEDQDAEGAGHDGVGGV